jgi:hypothetical protein
VFNKLRFEIREFFQNWFLVTNALAFCLGKNEVLYNWLPPDVEAGQSEKTPEEGDNKTISK